MVAADLHGSLTACERLLAWSRHYQVDQLLLLGDLLNHGPRNGLPEHYAPLEVAERLNLHARHILAVQGNCDSEVDQALLQFPILSRYSQVLSRFSGRVRRIFLTHGHHADCDHSLLAEGDMIATGHTHIPKIECTNGLWHLNPGSTTFPKGGSVASFALIDSESISLHALSDGERLQRCAWD